MQANKVFNNNSNIYIQGPKFQSNIVLFEKPKFISLNGAIREMYGISFLFEEAKDYKGDKRYKTVRIPLIGELLEPGDELKPCNSLSLPESKVMTPAGFKEYMNDVKRLYTISAGLNDMKKHGFSVDVKEDYINVNVTVYKNVVYFSSPYFAMEMNTQENDSYVLPHDFIEIIQMAAFLDRQLKFIPHPETEKENPLFDELYRMMQACIEYGVMDNGEDDSVYNDGTYSYTKNMGRIRMTREEYLKKFQDAVLITAKD